LPSDPFAPPHQERKFRWRAVWFVRKIQKNALIEAQTTGFTINEGDF
jgi:hypothetical protein